MEYIVEGFFYGLMATGYGWIIVGLFFIAMGMIAFFYGNVLAWGILSAIGALIIAASWWFKHRKRNEIND